MSKLSFLQGASKKFMIGNVELEIKPLRLDDMNLLVDDPNLNPTEQVKSSLKLIDKVLLESVPDSTEEERKNIGFEFMEPLMKAIMEVNGMAKQKGGLDAIKARQAQIKAKLGSADNSQH